MSTTRSWVSWVIAASLAVVTARTQDFSLDGLLPHIQHNVAEYVAAIPNYTCTEIIHRYQRPRRVNEFQTLDTIKLEVAVLNGTERFALAGSTEFGDQDLLKEIVGGSYGALSKGDFVIHARNIFLRDQATFRPPQMEKFGDRDAIRLDYEVPLAKSNFLLNADGKKAIVSYKGSVWVDKDTLQLIRINIEALGIPRELRLRAAESEVNYASARFGDAVVLLPSSSQITMQHSSGVDVRSRIEFSGCRQYGATTKLSFGDGAAGPAGSASEKSPEVRVPPGITLPLRLTDAIDSSRAAVGDAITATTSKRVQAGPSLVLPAGTMVRGRIRKMGQYNVEPPPGTLGTRAVLVFLIGLEFNELDVEGRRIRFFGELASINRTSGMSDDMLGRKTPEWMRPLIPSIPGVAILVFWNNKPQIEKGHALTWATKEFPAR